MSKIFKLKWGGEFENDKSTMFLGKEWRRGESCICAKAPTKYYDEILTEPRLNNCKPSCVPCQPTSAKEDTSEK
eukprot:6309998-Heterocapsa_arctica.AAC.1